VLRELGATAEELRSDTLRIVGPGALDREALASIGIDLDEVRRRAEESFGPGALDRVRGDCAGAETPFTPRSKEALERSLRSAQRLGDDFIATEHLLLGIADTAEGVAARMLAERGIAVERLEAAVERRRGAA
jgi:ATP-dependent Clp protease ATP-binding subunit ClpA